MVDAHFDNFVVNDDPKKANPHIDVLKEMAIVNIIDLEVNNKVEDIVVFLVGNEVVNSIVVEVFNSLLLVVINIEDICKVQKKIDEVLENFENIMDVALQVGK